MVPNSFVSLKLPFGPEEYANYRSSIKEGEQADPNDIPPGAKFEVEEQSALSDDGQDLKEKEANQNGN